MYKAEILADSLSPQGNRLTTMKITFPRIVLSEFNTHRMFSRNSASSRAIPFKKMVEMVKENPFVPIAWQKAHTGMQGVEYITDENDLGTIKCCEEDWLKARDEAINMAKSLNSLDVTKQLCNRLLEPFMWHTVIVSATEWENFFKLRCPEYRVGEFKYRSKKDAIKHQGDVGNKEIKKLTDLEWLQINHSAADIHIQAIAELMWDTMNESKPKQLQAGQWHIPFGDNISESDLSLINYGKLKSTTNVESLYSFTKIKIATARCARISYQTLGDNPKIDYEADIRLHDMLLKSGHWSPFEHIAKAMDDQEYYSYVHGKLDSSTIVEDAFIKINTHMNTKAFGWCRNFKGFISYRSMVDGK